MRDKEANDQIEFGRISTEIFQTFMWFIKKWEINETKIKQWAQIQTDFGHSTISNLLEWSAKLTKPVFHFLIH